MRGYHTIGGWWGATEPGTGNKYIYTHPMIPNSLLSSRNGAHIPEKWGSAMNSWGALSKERDYSGSSSVSSWSKTHVWYRLSRLQCRCGPRSLANTLTTGAPTRGQGELTLELMILGFHWIPLASIGFHWLTLASIILDFMVFHEIYLNLQIPCVSIMDSCWGCPDGAQVPSGEAQLSTLCQGGRIKTRKILEALTNCRVWCRIFELYI